MGFHEKALVAGDHAKTISAHAMRSYILSSARAETFRVFVARVK